MNATQEHFIERLRALGNSPVFHFSLGSKELFHSNFLAWICEQPEWSTLTSSFFRRFVPEGYAFDPRFKDSVLREKEHIDVWLTYRSVRPETDAQEWHVWIENKVKSLPREDQLQKYSSKKPENATCILLSLSEMKNISAAWEILSFAQLVEFVEGCARATRDAYHQRILLDYSSLLHALIELEQHADINNGEFFDFCYRSSPLLAALDEVRLDDFYLKKKYAGMAGFVWHAARQAGFLMAPVRSKIQWDLPERTVFVNSGMTRATGFMDIKFVIRPQLSIGIQIQGEQYRMVVEDNTGEKTAQFAQALLEAGLWFDFEAELDSGVRYPKRGGFNRFGPVFLYQSKKIPPTMMWKRVVDMCIRDLRKIEQRLSAIFQVIDYQ
jgi:hypothetical protein